MADLLLKSSIIGLIRKTSETKVLILSDVNMMRYYARLTSFDANTPHAVTLAELADLMFTSVRHARTLLGRMHQAQWVVWEPKAGRNQRSNLTLRYDVQGLNRHIASKLIAEGKYEKALAVLDDDRTVFGSLLQETSGATLRQGLLHVQLTYKRRFEALFPHHVHRSSERFLLRQVFSCLVSCSSDGVLKPELAHHWDYNGETQTWTFYLRPGLTFHNGQLIDGEQLVLLFEQLKAHSFYQSELEHVEQVYSDQPLRLCFKLSKADTGFAGLLAGVKYSIQPAAQLQGLIAPNIVGSGPFMIAEHDAERIKLKAFEHFFSTRSLTDEVTIWQFEEELAKVTNFDQSEIQVAPEEDASCFHQLGRDVNATETDEQYSRVEDGCLFVLFNHNASQQMLTIEQRKFLADCFKPSLVHEQLELNRGMFGLQHAKNILPSWSPVYRMPNLPCALPRKLTIAVYDYYALYRCAVSIADLLRFQGVEVEVNTYSFRDLTQRSQANQLNEDLILCNLNLDDNAPSSLFSWLMNDPVLHSALGQQSSEWLKLQLDQHKASVELEDYLERLEPIATSLVTDYWLLPLFHHLQTVRFQGILKNVAITNWGWPEFKDVWSVD